MCQRLKKEGEEVATKVGETYKCVVCTDVIKVTHEGKGVLVCFGKPMVLVNH
ncbi:desulfoferrodoxin FeS4 iron-binding domain-containing protein [Calderihabitans maritimus]|uniref:Desulfoferrodoxin Dfx domain-containing protein n=1 Tax=Calderihabitans maritimus TaxID=1246530 RepID=A0A1Z5HP70_9FIRM|nr:desulfoferrodoxin Dfx domain-containing protein [Calderihabitans maritimus]